PTPPGTCCGRPGGCASRRRRGPGSTSSCRGVCWLLPPEREPLRLGPGDVVFLRGGRGHGLADEPASPLTDFRPGRPAETTGDAAGATAVVLCGAYGLDQTRPHPVLADLAEVVHLPARLGRHPALRAAVGLRGDELEHPRPGSDAVVAALLEMLLLYIVRAWLEEQSERPGASGWALALNDPSIMATL